MGNNSKRILTVFLVFLFIVFSFRLLINITNKDNIYNKVKNTDFTDNESIFTLCKYLYYTDEYTQIYKNYFFIFKDGQAREFFENLGFDDKETNEYIISFGSRYLFSSAIINDKKIAQTDVVFILDYIQKINLVNEFKLEIENQFNEENGAYTTFYESIQERTILEIMNMALDDECINRETRIMFYEFIQGQYASMCDFESSDDFSRKIEKEKAEMKEREF